MDWSSTEFNLKKKTTFEAAVLKVADYCKQPENKRQEDVEQLWAVVKRVMMLLKSRYSSVAFWAKGRDLLVAAKGVLTEPQQRAQLDAYLQEAHTFLHAEDNPAHPSSEQPPTAQPTPPQQPQPYLFEGQFSAEPEHTHGEARFYQLAQSLFNTQGADSAESQEAALNQHFGQLLEQLLGAGAGGGDAGGLWETDLLGEGFAFEDVAPASRPASKQAVKKLKRVKVTDEVVRQFGADARCPVCMDSFKVGDEVQVLPCAGKHVFHPACLAPWLQQHNSCPMCRHELPTDDEEYERAKERDRVAAEERRGADNAVRGGEFIYI